VTRVLEEPCAEAPDDFQPLGRGVHEHQLIHGEQAPEPSDAVGELRRIR
jgi:hypothetical protein